jgi:hypothetical protein
VENTIQHAIWFFVFSSIVAVIAIIVFINWDNLLHYIEVILHKMRGSISPAHPAKHHPRHHPRHHTIHHM